MKLVVDPAIARAEIGLKKKETKIARKIAVFRIVRVFLNLSVIFSPLR